LSSNSDESGLSKPLTEPLNDQISTLEKPS
jgi:hypothetical protein